LPQNKKQHIANNNNQGRTKGRKIGDMKKTKSGSPSYQKPMAEKKNKPKPRKPSAAERTMDEKRELCEQICLAYESANVTLESCCGEHGITRRTFHNWMDADSQISARFKIAKQNHSKNGKERIREKAVDALERLVVGFYVEESETVELFGKNGELAGRQIKTKKRYIAPSTTAVIFTLKNSDPANWNENIQVEMTGEPQVFKIGNQTIEFT
jgi:hypothetical protein